jgi:hypothetical protein
MPTRAFFVVEDYGGEKSTMQCWVQDIGAGNYASVTQDIDEIKDELADIIQGEIREVGFTKTFPESVDAVEDEEAQRECKWLIVYRDTCQFLDAGNTIANAGYMKVFNVEAPTAMLSLLSGDAPDYADMSNEDIAAFVTSFEANARSPYNHTAYAPSIEVLRIVHVGRAT